MSIKDFRIGGNYIGIFVDLSIKTKKKNNDIKRFHSLKKTIKF